MTPDDVYYLWGSVTALMWHWSTSINFNLSWRSQICNSLTGDESCLSNNYIWYGPNDIYHRPYKLAANSCHSFLIDKLFEYYMMFIIAQESTLLVIHYIYYNYEALE